jgi:hypothetical protein
MDKRKYQTKTLIAEYHYLTELEDFRFSEIAYRLKDGSIVVEYEGACHSLYGLKLSFSRSIARKGIYSINDYDFRMWKSIRSQIESSSFIDWEKEMNEGIPFPQWNYPANEIHKLQWELTYLIINLIRQADHNSKDYEIARDLLDKGLHSCQWWWASARPWWDTGMIQKGAEQLYSAVDTLKESINSNEIKMAFELKEKVIETAKYYWESGLAAKLKYEYKEEFTEVENELSFG